jgi:hypothetical protein
MSYMEALGVPLGLATTTSKCVSPIDGAPIPCPTTTAAPAETSFFDKLVSGLKTGFTVYGQTQQEKALADLARQKAAAQGGGGGMPGWVMPVAVVGGLGVLAIVLLKKKKASP